MVIYNRNGVWGGIRDNIVKRVWAEGVSINSVPEVRLFRVCESSVCVCHVDVCVCKRKMGKHIKRYNIHMYIH